MQNNGQKKANERIRGHQLMTTALRKHLPDLYSTDAMGEKALVPVKYFTPDSSWYWYGAEFDGEDTFFGLVVGHSIELGYFSLSELESLRGPWGLPVERDLHFTPKTLAEIRQEHRSCGVLQ